MPARLVRLGLEREARLESLRDGRTRRGSRRPRGSARARRAGRARRRTRRPRARPTARRSARRARRRCRSRAVALRSAKRRTAGSAAVSAPSLKTGWVNRLTVVIGTHMPAFATALPKLATIRSRSAAEEPNGTRSSSWRLTPQAPTSPRRRNDLLRLDRRARRDAERVAAAVPDGPQAEAEAIVRTLLRMGRPSRSFVRVWSRSLRVPRDRSSSTTVASRRQRYGIALSGRAAVDEQASRRVAWPLSKLIGAGAAQFLGAADAPGDADRRADRARAPRRCRRSGRRPSPPATARRSAASARPTIAVLSSAVSSAAAASTTAKGAARARAASSSGCVNEHRLRRRDRERPAGAASVVEHRARRRRSRVVSVRYTAA